MHNSRFTKSSTKENDNMNDDLQHENLKGDTYNEVKRNDILMDVNIDMEPFTNLQLQHKHMSIDGKDNDDQFINFAKLFGCPTMPSELNHFLEPSKVEEAQEWYQRKIHPWIPRWAQFPILRCCNCLSPHFQFTYSKWFVHVTEHLLFAFHL